MSVSYYIAFEHHKIESVDTDSITLRKQTLSRLLSVTRIFNASNELRNKLLNPVAEYKQSTIRVAEIRWLVDKT